MINQLTQNQTIKIRSVHGYLVQVILQLQIIPDIHEYLQSPFGRKYMSPDAES